MIKTHKWTCKKCDDKLFLRVDDSKELDLLRFDKFQQYASRHVITTDHEMIHVEKEESGAKYV